MIQVKTSLDGDPDRARSILRALLGEVTLHHRDGHLVADMRPDVRHVLGLNAIRISGVPEEGLEPPRV
jgi:hypothetical protein